MPAEPRRRWSFLARSLCTIASVIVLWQIVASLRLVSGIFLPSPGATFAALRDLVVSGKFFSALLISVGRVTFATALSIFFGTAIGVLMGFSRTAESFLLPLTQPLRYLPITAIIPLLVLWLGIGQLMKVMFLFLGITFYFIPLVQNAIRNVPAEYIDVARSFGASQWEIIRHVYCPHALPQIYDGLVVINGLGWNYVILAEIVNAQNGLGYLIYIAGRLARSDMVFAGLLLIAAVAIGSEVLLRAVRKRFLFW